MAQGNAARIGWRMAAAASFALLAIPGAARADEPIGQPCLTAQIIHLTGEREGDVVVLSTRGVPRAALRKACLHRGEMVVVRGRYPAAVTIRSRGRVHDLTSQSDPFVVPGPEERSFSERAATWLRSLRIFNASSDPAPVETFGRKGLLTVQAHPMLRSELQFLPADARSVTALWLGEAAPVVLGGAGAVVTRVSSGASNWAVLEPLPPSGPLELQVGTSPKWRVAFRPRSAVPEPEWMSGRASVTDEERLVRATWILVAGPAEWRLFAVGELRQLSATGYAAERVWEWVRTNEAAQE